MLELVQRYSQLRPEITTIRIGLDWLTIFCVAYYSTLMPYFYPIAVLVIGSRMHALGIISHDFVHYRFIKNRKQTDLIGNIFLCWPLFFTLEGYRVQHLQHHSKVNTDQDPDLARRMDDPEWQFPQGKLQFYSMLFRDFFGFNVFQYFQRLFRVKSNNKKLKLNNDFFTTDYKLKMLLFYTIVLSIILNLNLEIYFLLFWLVPIATSLKGIKRIRAIAEHFAIEDNGYDELTRTTYSLGVERYLIGAHNVGFHVEHHRFPAIPWYNLEAFSKKIDPNKWGHYTSGYVSGLFNEASYGPPIEDAPSSPVAIR